MTNQMVREAFTKAFDHKWMVAEPGGLFEGPSGKHSSRVGELKIGDIIKADAETFDPDNKIIWRLHADTPVGEKGNWMYAPVRGPKTAVPLNEALLKRVEDGVKFYKVNGKKGTIVRKEADMSSDKVQIIESGTVVSVVETTELDNGKVRYEIDEPVQGWVTSTQVDRWYKELPRSAFAK
ncbi:unnamed protein product [Pelagomonas calceolata]|uniref:Uncharacterized protein n=2 Tax=Pelagomonas calceolata TaxID=35677 RepID=A0A8J2SUR1_9STRA|nr:unnamed protein product [Pelagomonas calceolata]